MSITQDKLRHFVKNSGLFYWESGNSYVFTCPRCNKKDKLWMYKSSGWFSCFVCKETSNFRGKPEFAFSELLSIRLSDAQELLYGTKDPLATRLDLQLKDHYGDQKEDEEDETLWLERKLVGYEWPPYYVPYSDPLFQKGRLYLHGRGVDEQMIQKYDIRYATAQGRVVFPYVVQGQLVGWQGRAVGSLVTLDSDTGREVKIPKSLTHTQDNIQSNYVMFNDNLNEVNHCILTEGPIDALKCELAGGNVAALGKGVTESQLNWISERVSKLYVGLDEDAGVEIERIKRWAFARKMEVYQIVPPSGRQDLGDCSLQEALDAFRGAAKMKPGQISFTLGGRLVF